MQAIHEKEMRSLRTQIDAYQVRQSPWHSASHRGDRPPSCRPTWKPATNCLCDCVRKLTSWQTTGTAVQTTPVFCVCPQSSNCKLTQSMMLGPEFTLTS